MRSLNSSDFSAWLPVVTTVSPAATPRTICVNRSCRTPTSTRRVEVHAETANPDRKLRPRTFGTATVVVRQEPLAIVVPAEAIQADEVPPKPGEERRADRHFSFLFVRTSDKSFQVRSVMTELREGGFIQVRGVRAGEEVATAGSYVLKSELFKERIAGGD